MCLPTSFLAGTTNVSVTVDATDSQGISNVIIKGVYDHNYSGGSCSVGVPPVTEDQKTAVGPAPTFKATLVLNNPPISTPPKCYQIGATATNSCGTAASTSVQVILANSCYPVIAARDVKESLAWSSDLDVEGGQLQIIVNGSATSYPDAGRAYGMGALIDGSNHVEATLVEGKGKAGLWRFEFLNAQAIASGSIRVLAGDAVTVAASAVTFRLKGTPGERIAFTFDKK
jgi:hypothetical protein